LRAGARREATISAGPASARRNTQVSDSRLGAGLAAARAVWSVQIASRGARGGHRPALAAGDSLAAGTETPQRNELITATALRAPDRSREGQTRAGMTAVSPMRGTCQERRLGREPQRNHSLPRHADCHSAGTGLIVPKADPGHGPSGLRSADSAQRSAPRHPRAWRRWLARALRSCTSRRDLRGCGFSPEPGTRRTPPGPWCAQGRDPFSAQRWRRR
jgi:hypothetical protein